MENELLIMSEDFKQRMAKKNREMCEMKQVLCIVYGMIRIEAENENLPVATNFEYVLQLIESVLDMSNE